MYFSSRKSKTLPANLGVIKMSIT